MAMRSTGMEASGVDQRIWQEHIHPRLTGRSILAPAQASAACGSFLIAAVMKSLAKRNLLGDLITDVRDHDLAGTNSDLPLALLHCLETLFYSFCKKMLSLDTSQGFKISGWSEFVLSEMSDAEMHFW
jgi:hypothetical protein